MMQTALPHSEKTESNWRIRLSGIVDMMRELSRQTDPQEMVELYGKRMRALLHIDRFLSLSRRDLPVPMFRVTRYSGWKTAVNPWKQLRELPLLRGGQLGDLIYGEEPIVIPDFEADPADPAYEYLAGMRSLMAIPLYDKGESLNMVVLAQQEPGAFSNEGFPEQVWLSNLFGRATHSLVMAQQVSEAFAEVDRELAVVGDIQRSLLPEKLPEVPTLDLSVHYQTSRRAGGDYYDFFPLIGANGEAAGTPGGRWGILIADVSGHGTPAAVLMAVTHSIAHTCCEPSLPSRLLKFVNRHLCARYTGGTGTFVTAFYGIYDPSTRRLVYASAGHCPPRLRDGAGNVRELQAARHLPLGIDDGEPYSDGEEILSAGDLLALYTDGITEARDGDNDLFGITRLDEILQTCDGDANHACQRVLDRVQQHMRSHTLLDDRTLLLAKVS